tara:strand:+ start:84 stop:557 length:474 start_codon:yes stop_codon:yes gene_type:complete
MKKNNINKDNVHLVQTFVDIVNKDNLSELEYEADDIKVKIVSKNFFQDNSQTQIIQRVEKQEIKPSPKQDIETPKFTSDHPGAVNSPMVGTAYSAPEPGKEPFIKLNSTVSKGDTLLIIEAMKVMNTIAAHKSGKVVFIGFVDSQPVEFNELLVIIE